MKNIINKIKFSKAIDRKVEEQFYAQVSAEMASGEINQGLWAKAIEKSNGNSGKQVSEYIKLRVQSLYDEIEISKQIEKKGSPQEKIISEPPIYEKLCNYIKNDNINGIKSLFEDMSSQEIVKLIQTEDELEDYPIHMAAREGSVEAIEWLIKNGADIEMTNCWNLTPLQVAQKAKQEKAAEIILNHST